MTVITKPMCEKKSDKMDEPLVENEHIPDLPSKLDLEAAAEPQYYILRTPTRNVSSATTVCLFLTALSVMSIGIMGGVYLYHKVASSQIQRFRGWCSVPYEASKSALYQDDPMHSGGLRTKDDHTTEFLKEEFEMDLKTNKYQKIDVPDFRGARRGRFVHDFDANKTGIVDLDYRRCFVMPLNRHRVLPPRSLLDLVKKMWDGYYDVDTEVVRETMEVSFPPIKDLNSVGRFIARECKHYPTYMLVKSMHATIWKRSIAGDNVKYAEFAGKNIVELEITNLDQITKYEAENSINA